jgi:hypothetical protein
MAFRSQRVVPGSGKGSLPDRTQLEKAPGEILQYAAACRLFNSLGIGAELGFVTSVIIACLKLYVCGPNRLVPRPELSLHR